MKPTLIVVSFLLLSTISRAHDYFFAFAEVEYNSGKEVLEITLESAAHDVVRFLQSEEIAISDLTKHYNDSAMNVAIETSINQHLSFSTANQSVFLHLDGYEVLPNGLVLFYLSSGKIQLQKELTCRFDWLMSAFSEQQNKLTLTVHKQKYTAVFLNRQPVVTLNIQEE